MMVYVHAQRFMNTLFYFRKNDFDSQASDCARSWDLSQFPKLLLGKFPISFSSSKKEENNNMDYKRKGPDD